MAERQPSVVEIGAFLEDHHGSPVGALTPLKGGFWSSAFSYVADGSELVLRLGAMREGFEMDRAAHAWAGPGLPVPEVYDIGDAFGQSFAISKRAHGAFVEDLAVGDARSAGAAFEALFEGLRRASDDGAAPVSWLSSQAQPTGGTWAGWLGDRLVDDPTSVVSGWRKTLAADPKLDALYRACEQRHLEMLPSIPERRDLVHGDLLHQNVLITPDASEITAVFSWKCSVLGDFLYDVAWFTFWSPWHPGIAALDMWELTLTAAGRGEIPASDLLDAHLRHHAYEVNIGAQHLAWCSWTNNATELWAVANHTAEVLERGPLPHD